VTGTRAGAPVNDHEAVSDTIDALTFSRAYFLTADVIYRWFTGRRGEDFLGRFQPYAGVGIGAVIPHVESTIGEFTLSNTSGTVRCPRVPWNEL